MARTGSATVKTPPAAVETSSETLPVVVQEPPVEVQVPEGGLAIATASGEVRTVKLCRGCSVEMPADSEHNYCEACHQKWLAEQREEAQARLPEGKAFCDGKTADGKLCRRVVDRGPDGKPRPCLKCDATRLIFGAKSSIVQSDNRGHAVLEEARVRLAEAEECFLDGRYWNAREAAREAHHLQAKARVEYRLSRIPEYLLSSAEFTVYDRVQELYEAKDYFGASRALNTLREISRREQRSRELDQVTERALESGLGEQRDDRGGRRREQDDRRRAHSERDKQIRLGMKGSNSSPSRGRRQ